MQEYILRRKVPPKEIIFYRDGVGEGMYDLVKKDEIAQLMRAIGEICVQHKQEVSFLFPTFPFPLPFSRIAVFFPAFPAFSFSFAFRENLLYKD